MWTGSHPARSVAACVDRTWSRCRYVAASDNCMCSLRALSVTDEWIARRAGHFPLASGALMFALGTSPLRFTRVRPPLVSTIRELLTRVGVDGRVARGMAANHIHFGKPRQNVHVERLDRCARTKNLAADCS